MGVSSPLENDSYLAAWDKIPSVKIGCEPPNKVRGLTILTLYSIVEGSIQQYASRIRSALGGSIVTMSAHFGLPENNYYNRNDTVFNGSNQIAIPIEFLDDGDTTLGVFSMVTGKNLCNLKQTTNSQWASFPASVVGLRGLRLNVSNNSWFNLKLWVATL